MSLLLSRVALKLHGQKLAHPMVIHQSVESQILITMRLVLIIDKKMGGLNRVTFQSPV